MPSPNISRRNRLCLMRLRRLMKLHPALLIALVLITLIVFSMVHFWLFAAYDSTYDAKGIGDVFSMERIYIKGKVERRVTVPKTSHEDVEKRRLQLLSEIEHIKADIDATDSFESYEAIPWVPLEGTDFVVASAYYDTRPMLFGRRPHVLILGAQSVSSRRNHNYYCYFAILNKISNSVEIMYRTKLVIDDLSSIDENGYSDVNIMCPVVSLSDHKEFGALLEGTESKLFVTIFHSSKLSSHEDFEERWIPVELMPQFPSLPIQISKFYNDQVDLEEFTADYDHESPNNGKSSVGICFNSEASIKSQPKAWIEYYRLLGAEKFVSYRFDSTVEPEILNEYRKKRILKRVRIISPSTSELEKMRKTLDDYSKIYPKLIAGILERPVNGVLNDLSVEELEYWLLFKTYQQKSSVHSKLYSTAVKDRIVRYKSSEGWWEKLVEDIDKKLDSPDGKANEPPFLEPPELRPQVRWLNYSEIMLKQRVAIIQRNTPSVQSSFYSNRGIMYRDCVLRLAGLSRWITFPSFTDEFLLPRLDVSKDTNKHLSNLIRENVQSKVQEEIKKRKEPILISSIGIPISTYCTNCAPQLPGIYDDPSHAETSKLLLSFYPSFKSNYHVQLNALESKDSENGKYSVRQLYGLEDSDYIRATKSVNLPNCNSFSSIHAMNGNRLEYEDANRSCVKLASVANIPSAGQLSPGAVFQDRASQLHASPSCFYQNTSRNFKTEKNVTLKVPLPVVLHSVTRENNLSPAWKNTLFIMDPYLVWNVKDKLVTETTLRKFGPREDECRRAWWRHKFISRYNTKALKNRVVLKEPTQWKLMVNSMTLRWTRSLKWISKEYKDKDEEVNTFLSFFNGCNVDNATSSDPVFTSSISEVLYTDPKDVIVNKYLQSAELGAVDASLVNEDQSSWDIVNRNLWDNKKYECSRCAGYESVLDFTLVNRYGDLLLQRLMDQCLIFSEKFVSRSKGSGPVILRNDYTDSNAHVKTIIVDDPLQI